jgi:transcriptional antiterminator RfaH
MTQEVNEMNTEVIHDQAQWYAVRTKPHEEARAEMNLRAWRVEIFAPKLKELRTSDYGDARYVTKPLFTQYLFARFDVETQLHDINYTRGVQSVVCFGGIPASIDDKVIDLIKERVDKDGFVRTQDDFKAGEPVRIKSGPMQSIIGVFERKLKDKDRVKILLNTMHLLIDTAMIEKVS